VDTRPFVADQSAISPFLGGSFQFFTLNLKGGPEPRARELKICRIVVYHNDGTKLELSSGRCGLLNNSV